eukprot:TRINITY_DN4093_c0_g1_i1.p1 TRINITY_DN4093_c0_g1~~TRINITY_DN4093_c0_g1_i1.p1  ORF type:complete len:435 (-),score=55.08 TRINITY_DN4093_c0_g1_i1:861-2165(-)
MRAVFASVAVAACLSCSEAFAPHAGSCTTSRRAQLTVAAGAAPSRSVGVSAARRGARRAGATISMGAGAVTADAAYAPPDAITPEHPLRVILAGGGVGGLLAAKYLKQSGFDVTVFEKTDSFKRFGGPIQLASNALSTIKAIDPKLFESLMKKFTFTGVRTNGIMDGLRTEWYTKFDAITAAADMRGLPYTGVVDRPDLQAILLEDLGENVVHNANTVCGYRNTDNGVEVLLEGGKTMHGDVLIGADGIWSQVRLVLMYCTLYCCTPLNCKCTTCCWRAARPCTAMCCLAPTASGRRYNQVVGVLYCTVLLISYIQKTDWRRASGRRCRWVISVLYFTVLYCTVNGEPGLEWIVSARPRVKLAARPAPPYLPCRHPAGGRHSCCRGDSWQADLKWCTVLLFCTVQKAQYLQRTELGAGDHHVDDIAVVKRRNVC